MLDSKTYQQELVRMWDSLRDDNKGLDACDGVDDCEKCPLHGLKYGCDSASSVIEIYNAVEKWSKEHPKHYYVSQLEYDILCIALDYEFIGFDYYWLGELLEKGYFKGATLNTDIVDYFNHCEVVDNEMGTLKGENKNGN